LAECPSGDPTNSVKAFLANTTTLLFCFSPF